MPEALDESDFRRLVASARWGDDHAWRTLVEHWTPRLFAFLHSRCRDPELSEELVQDVFVKVAQRLVDYDERGRFSSWIMLIAINRLRDEMRRRTRHARPVEHETLGPWPAAPHRPRPMLLVRKNHEGRWTTPSEASQNPNESCCT